MDYYAAVIKDEIMKFPGTWMILEGVILSEISQKDIKRQDKTRQAVNNDKRLALDYKTDYQVFRGKKGGGNEDQTRGT